MLMANSTTNKPRAEKQKVAFLIPICLKPDCAPPICLAILLHSFIHSFTHSVIQWIFIDHL